MKATVQYFPSMAGPQPVIVGLFYVTYEPGGQSVGAGSLTLPDAQRLARWARKAGKAGVTIRRSEDFSTVIPVESEGEAAWPPPGRQYLLREGRIITGVEC